MIALTPAVFADIHKCTDEHGNVAYLQLPCPAEVDQKATDTDNADERATDTQEGDEVIESVPEPQPAAAKQPSSRQPGESLDVCKKRYRDKIDAIDAEMRVAFSAEKASAYKTRLLNLTQQLRACG